VDEDLAVAGWEVLPGVGKVYHQRLQPLWEKLQRLLQRLHRKAHVHFSRCDADPCELDVGAFVQHALDLQHLVAAQVSRGGGHLERDRSASESDAVRGVFAHEGCILGERLVVCADALANRCAREFWKGIALPHGAAVRLVVL
jgi:hypothetical protein